MFAALTATLLASNLVYAAAVTSAAPRLASRAADPYAHTDFTAYTLEPGEVRLSLTGLAVGIVPRVQVGTKFALDALKVLNAQIKFNPLRVGSLDGSLGGAVYSFHGPTLDALVWNVTSRVSVQLGPEVAVHVSGTYASGYAQGTPNLDPIVPLITLITGEEYSPAVVAETESRLAFVADASAISAQLAADIHLNRRDSFIVQVGSMVWGASDLPVTIPAELTGGQEIHAQGSGFVSPTDAFIGTLAYQMSFKNLEVRAGLGVSSTPGAWLMQSTQVAYQFGGPSRRAERRAHQAEARATAPTRTASR